MGSTMLVVFGLNITQVTFLTALPNTSDQLQLNTATTPLHHHHRQGQSYLTTTPLHNHLPRRQRRLPPHLLRTRSTSRIRIQPAQLHRHNPRPTRTPPPINVTTDEQRDSVDVGPAGQAALAEAASEGMDQRMYVSKRLYAEKVMEIAKGCVESTIGLRG